MIGEQTEKNINKKDKNKIQLVVSIVIIILIIILFAVFMRLDFSNKENTQEVPSLTPQERGAIVDEATKDMEFSTVEERAASISNVNIKSDSEERMRAVNQ